MIIEHYVESVGNIASRGYNEVRLPSFNVDVFITLVTLVEMLERMGLIIAAKRAEMCIGQKELADRAGIHRTYISDIERGRRNVTIGTLNKIAEVLGMTVGQLLVTAENATNEAAAAGNGVAELDVAELQPESDKLIS